MLSACSLNNEVALFCVCVVCFLFFVNKPKWFSGLHLVFFVVLCSIFVFCPSKKRPKNGHSKNQKKKAEKRTNNQLALLCSKIVFLIF